MDMDNEGLDDEDALFVAEGRPAASQPAAASGKGNAADDGLSDSMRAMLAKMRDQG